MESFGLARLPRSRIYQHRAMYCAVRENVVAARNPYEFRRIYRRINPAILFKQICHANARGTYFELKYVLSLLIDVIIIIIIIIIFNDNPYQILRIFSVKYPSGIKFNKCYHDNRRRKKNISRDWWPTRSRGER